MGSQCKHDKVCILKQQNEKLEHILQNRIQSILELSFIAKQIYQSIQTMSCVWIKPWQISLQADVRHYLMLPFSRHIGIRKNDLEEHSCMHMQVRANPRGDRLEPFSKVQSLP